MNGKEPSGKRLFLMYAGVCAEIRHKLKLISDNDLDKIKWLLGDKIEPEIGFLEHCFPTAVMDYLKCESCKDENRNTDFSYASVANHWRYHHQGNTPVIFAMITEITGGKVIVFYDSRTFEVSNPYQLSLEPVFSLVSVHCDTAIEEIE